jgi:type III secretion protein L
MAVWFRHGSFAVGVDDGLIRAKDFARFTSLLNAARTVSRERDRLLAHGEAEVSAMRAQAAAEVAAMAAAAEQERARAYREGLERGLREANEQWTERAMRVAWSRQRDLERQTERLSQIVAMAIDRILEKEDRGALYQRAVRTVARLVKDVPLLRLRVPEAERDTAQAAVDAVLSSLEAPPRIEVTADASLDDGGCIFETDNGVVDASLDVQLAAIKRAVTRAAELAAAEADSLSERCAEPSEPEQPLAEAAEMLEFQYDDTTGDS